MIDRPTQVAGLSDVIDVVSGGRHSCALLRSGVMKCWGDDSTMALGRAHPQGDGCEGLDDGNGVGPVLRLPEGSDVIKMAAGTSHTCALMNDGALYCWGDDSQGALGRGEGCHPDPTPRRVIQTDWPVERVISFFTDVAAGNNLTCATGLIENGEGNDFSGRQLWCWGSNARGQLGTGNPDNNFAIDKPMRVMGSGFGAISRIAAGSGSHACAGTSNNRWCWGAGNASQLGNCQANDSPTRQRVLGNCG